MSPTGHVMILARVLPAYLQDLEVSVREGRMPERKLAEFLEQLHALLISPKGRKAVLMLKFAPRELFAELTGKGVPKVGAFLTKRLKRAALVESV